MKINGIIFSLLIASISLTSLNACGIDSYENVNKRASKDHAKEAKRILSSVQTGTPINSFYNIAGISIGDSPKAAYIAATNKGYKFDSYGTPGFQKARNFEEHIKFVKSKDTSISAQLDLDNSSSSWKAFRLSNGFEEIRVDFQLKPKGHFVHSVSYYNNDPTMNFERLLKKTEAKYGSPKDINPGYEALFAKHGSLYGGDAYMSEPHITMGSAGIGSNALAIRLSGGPDRNYDIGPEIKKRIAVPDTNF